MKIHQTNAFQQPHHKCNLLI